MEETQYVDSTNISTISYDTETRVLTIEFVKGAEYMYHEVPTDVWEAFKDAPSKGRFFHAHIRDEFISNKVKDNV